MIFDILEILIKILLSLASVIVLISSCIYIFNLNKKESELLFQSGDSKSVSTMNWLILCGAYLGFYIAFQQGILACLFWLPRNWGGLDFFSLKMSISFILAYFGVYCLADNIESLFRYRLISEIEKETSKYEALIDSPYSDLDSVKSELEELFNYQKNLVQNRNQGVFDPRTHRIGLVARERAQAYYRLLKTIENKRIHGVKSCPLPAKDKT